jgi:cysteine desulfurase
VSRHYFDHASTSPMRPEAVAAMTSWLGSPLAGDPSRIHTEGHAGRAVTEEARAAVAALLGTRPRSVVFTSGATEAIAAATWGAVERGGHVVVPAVEHSAVRLTSEMFAASVTVVGCDHWGRVDPDAVVAAIRPDTGLVHVQWGNHEVGTLQPVAGLVAACRERGVLVHVDAAQAAGRVPVDFDALGADLLSVSAHKMGGPAGVGAMLVRRGLRVRPLLLGGDQERARRGGLENVAALAGWGAVAESLVRRIAGESPEGRRIDGESARMKALTERVVAGATALGGVRLLGDPHTDGRLPHIACFGVEGVEPQAVLLGLDQAGIAAHSGSACASEDLEPSPVLEAMGVDAHHSLRLSVGWNTTDADVDALLDALPPVLDGLRALAAQSPQ